jgi:prefoldin subunit 5
MDSEQEIFKQIDAIPLPNDKGAPKYIDFYIQYWGERKLDLGDEIEDLNKDIEFFKERYQLNLSKSELRDTYITEIERLKNEIETTTQLIAEAKRQYTNYKAVRAAYVLDAGRGVYYNRDTGEALPMVDGKIPDNAYVVG